MAAPSETIWGKEYSTTTYFAFRLGLYVETVVSNAQVKANIQVWFWSQHSLNDDINLFYRVGQGITTAFDEKNTYLVSRPHVNCPANGEAGWSTTNQIRLYSTSHTYQRDTSAKTINIYAHVGEIYNYSTSKGGLITVSSSITILALPTSLITYNANGGTGAPGSQTKTHGIPIQISSKTPTRTGYTFKGWALDADFAEDGLAYYQAGDWCPLDGGLTLYAVWQINNFTNTVASWLFGFTKGEGNNGNKDSFLLGNGSFTATYGSAVTLNAPKAQAAPNGTSLKEFGSQHITGAWEKYAVGSKITQPNRGCHFEAYFHATNYTITYNLEGGAFDSDPPTTYNVLYQVLFPTPKRAGYSFVGWYVDGWDLPVSGVNVGVNASFTSAEDLYAKLATRTTGNVTVTARWADNGTAHIKQDGIWKKGQVWFKHAGSWKRGIPWVKVNGAWKRGGA